MKKTTFKKKVLQRAKQLIQSRIDDIEKQIARLESVHAKPSSENVDLVYKSQNEANHEISNKLAESLNEAVRSLTRLELIELSGDLSEAVEPEAIVETDRGTFFISVHTGTFEIEGKEVMGISTKSPIYQQMAGLKKGVSLQFRDMQYNIEDIY